MAQRGPWGEQGGKLSDSGVVRPNSVLNGDDAVVIEGVGSHPEGEFWDKLCVDQPCCLFGGENHTREGSKKRVHDRQVVREHDLRRVVSKKVDS